MGSFNLGYDTSDLDEEQRRMEAAFSALSDAGHSLTLPDSRGDNPALNYSAASQAVDLGAGGDPLGALAEEGGKPDPVEDQLATAASALSAQNDNSAPGEAPTVSNEPTEVFFRENGRYPNPEERTTLYKQLNNGAEPTAELIQSWQDNPDWKTGSKEEFNLAAGGGGEAPKNADPSSSETPSATPPKPTLDPAPSPDPTEPPPGTPEPGKGPSSATDRSPEAKDLKPAYGTGQAPPANADDAAKTVANVPSNSEPPKAGSAQTLTQTPPPPEDHPRDLWQALKAEGEAQRRQMLASMGERPGVSGWAILADSLFNRGRSIPDIIRQAEAAGARYDDDKRKIQMHQSDPIQQQLALQRIQGTEEARKIQRERMEATRAANAAKAEQDKADVGAFLETYKDRLSPEQYEKLKSASPAVFRSLANELREKWKQSPEYQTTHALGQEKDAGAREQGTIQARAANLPTATNNARELSRAAAEGAEPSQIRVAQTKQTNADAAPQTPQEIEDARLKREAAARDQKRIELQEKGAADAEAARKAAADNAERDKAVQFKRQFRADTLGSSNMIADLDRLQALTDKYKDKDFGFGKGVVPGKGVEGLSAVSGGMISGIISAFGAQATKEILHDADEYKRLSEGLGIDQLYEKSGKTFGNKEIALNAFRTGISPTAFASQVQDAQDTLRDIVRRGIASAGSARPDLAREDMLDQGLDADRWTPPTWKQSRVVPQTQLQQTAGTPYNTQSDALPQAPLTPEDHAINGLTGKPPAPMAAPTAQDMRGSEELAPPDGEGGGVITKGPPPATDPMFNPDGTPSPLNPQYGNIDVSNPKTGAPPENLGVSAKAAGQPSAAAPKSGQQPSAAPTFSVVVIDPKGNEFPEPSVTADELKMLEGRGFRITKVKQN